MACKVENAQRYASFDRLWTTIIFSLSNRPSPQTKKLSVMDSFPSESTDILERDPSTGARDVIYMCISICVCLSSSGLAFVLSSSREKDGEVLLASCKTMKETKYYLGSADGKDKGSIRLERFRISLTNSFSLSTFERYLCFTLFHYIVLSYLFMAVCLGFDEGKCIMTGRRKPSGTTDARICNACTSPP